MSLWIICYNSDRIRSFLRFTSFDTTHQQYRGGLAMIKPLQTIAVRTFLVIALCMVIPFS